MKAKFAACALAAAIVLAFLNMLLPPIGEIHTSVLNITAQLLIFAATLLGVDAMILRRMGKK